MDGEAHGASIISGILLSLDECALKCRDNPKCKSFEHNVLDNHCALNSIEHPNRPQNREYMFCSKKGINFQIYKNHEKKIFLKDLM